MAASLAFASGCGDGDDGASGTTSGPSPGGPPVVVDTDLASDDLVALAFLLASAEVDVVAVTVSGTGEVRCPRGVEVVRGLLAVTGDEDVPLACGRTDPLAGDHAFPDEWRDAADDAWGLELPEAADGADAGTATDLLAESLGPGVTLLTLGPLTNAAEAFREDPGLARRVESIVVMGGALDVAGNADASPRAEWNVHIDPTAAAEVLASGAPVVMVGLDATAQVPVTGDLLELLGANARTEEAALAHRLLRENPLVHTGEAYLWDPLAAAVVVDPALVTTRTEPVSIVTDEGPDSGRTVRSPGGRPVTVADDVDAGAFEELLIRTLGGVDPGDPLAAPPVPVADIAIRYDAGACRHDGPRAVPAGRLRFAFSSDEPGWSGVVAPLTGETDGDGVLTWIDAHPGDTRVPGIGRPVAFTGSGGVGYTDVPPAGSLILCADDAGTVVPAGVLAVR